MPEAFKYLNVKADGTEKFVDKLKIPYTVEGNKIRPLYGKSINEVGAIYCEQAGKSEVTILISDPRTNYKSDKEFTYYHTVPCE